MTNPKENPFELIDAEVGGKPCRIFANVAPNMGTLLQALDTFSEREFIVDGEHRLTYRQAKAATVQLANHLAEAGIGAGDRVAVALPNSAEWIIAFLALVARGAVPTLINARGAAEEVRYCIESTGCKAWIAGERTINIDIDPGITCITPETLARLLNEPAEGDLTIADRSHGDEALLMFTSGTTGRAKAASLTHLGVLTMLKSVEYSGFLIASDMARRFGIDLETLMAMRPPTVTLLMFPLFHVSGCHAVMLSNLTQGGKIVLQRRWDAREAVENIAREKVTAFPAVPTMYWDLMKVIDETQLDVSSLTSLSVGGQATPAALLHEVVERFPSAVIGTGYGMTENNGTVSMSIGENFLSKPHATGKPLPTVQVLIRDDDGRECAAGETGEIHIRGATLMTGYANAEPPFFDEDGWFATGDIGLLDEDGDLCIVDRRTDMVISAGENIYCAEVERAINLHPAIRESAAFGLPDERLGERVVAVASLETGAQADTDEVLTSLDAHLARYKIPRALLITSEALPRNPAGKLIKPQIKEQFFNEDTNA